MFKYPVTGISVSYHPTNKKPNENDPAGAHAPYVRLISLVSPGLGYPDFEIVESIPAQTMLDNPDIRNTVRVWTEMIDAAKTSIDFEEFYISNQPGESLESVLKSVVAAAERGVRIRFIVDAGNLQNISGDCGFAWKNPEYRCTNY